MRPQRLLAIAAAAALAAGWAAAQGNDRPCKRLDVSSLQEPQIKNGKGFSAARTVDLTIMLFFKQKIDRDTIAELRFFTPDGFLYRSSSVPIPPAGRPPGERRIAGYPHPVRERPVITERTANGLEDRIEVEFPVAGTDIVSSGLYGEWRVEAFVGGSGEPCAPALSFTLGP